MCTVSIVGLAVGAVGTIASTGLQMAAQGNAANRAAEDAEAGADAAAQNAYYARKQKADALQRGAEAAGRIVGQGRSATGSDRTQAALSGVESTSGSMADVIGESEVNASLDASRVRANAARRAWGFDVEESNYKRQEKTLRERAREAREAGILGQVGTAVGGVGALASRSIKFAGGKG